METSHFLYMGNGRVRTAFYVLLVVHSLARIMNRSRIRKVKSNVCEVQIKAGTTFQLPVVVTEPGTELHWGFFLDYYDIDFEIKMESESEEQLTILELKTFVGGAYQNGVVSLETPGIYYLIWDNKRSWIRGKTVAYEYTLVLPELTLEEKTRCARYDFHVVSMA